MVSVSLPPASVIVMVALVSDCVVELSAHAEQSVEARIASENVAVPASPVSILAAVPPLASTTPVGEGLVVSIVTTSAPLEDEMLPAASVAVTVIVCAPVESVDTAIDQLPPVAVPLPTCVTPSNSLTVVPASAVPVNVGVALLVRLSP